MLTRCKVRCESVTQDRNGMYSYLFYPVTGGSEENEQFFRWTPNGKIEFGVTTEKKFEPGEEYYLDFTLAT